MDKPHPLNFPSEHTARLEFQPSKPLKDVSNKTLRRLSQGDHSAFETVFVSYHSSVKRYINAVIRNNEESAEIAQNVFIRIWENHAEIDPEKNIKGYLHRTAKFYILDYFKRKKVIHKYENFKKSDFDYIALPDDQIIEKELNLLARITIEKMPPQRRKVFEMRYNDCKSLEEIASELGIASETTRKHLALGKKEIEKILKAYMIILFMAQL